MTSAHRPGPTTSLAELELVPAVVAADDATLREVAGLMVASGVSAVLVGGAHSIITERDVVRAMARGVPCDEPASPYATADPLLVLDSSSVMEALGVMLDRGIRNIVVVSENPSSRARLISVTQAAAVVLGGSGLPPWLTGLRLALGVETR